MLVCLLEKHLSASFFQKKVLTPLTISYEYHYNLYVYTSLHSKFKIRLVAHKIFHTLLKYAVTNSKLLVFYYRNDAVRIILESSFGNASDLTYGSRRLNQGDQLQDYAMSQPTSLRLQNWTAKILVIGLGAKVIRKASTFTTQYKLHLGVILDIKHIHSLIKDCILRLNTLKVIAYKNWEADSKVRAS